jgi:Microtubule-associated tyrosine carboxypeptidase
MTLYRRALERGLGRAERTIALVERCRPLNGAEEQARVLGAWRRGDPVNARFHYAPLHDLSELASGLERLAEGARELGPWGELYAARARELGLEAELVPVIGAPDFARRAASRFCAGDSRDAARAERWARTWTSLAPESDPDPGSDSDDEQNPESLVSAMRSAVGRARLPFRVIRERGMLAAAATGDGVILVRIGVRLRGWEVRRIVVHEIHGHALPRARASRESLGLYAVGSHGGSDDEEGRALLIEHRHGCLCPRRRAELGARHLAALSVRAGADFVETARLVVGHLGSLERAVTIASRVHRGGGLAREIVYLPALSRVERAFSADPELERFLERGRIGIEAAKKLRELGAPPDLFDVTRAA